MRQRHLTTLFSSILLFSTNLQAADPIVHGPVDAQVSVCFVPESPCEGAVVNAINSAKTSIRMQAYELSLRAVTEALIKAYKRGVDVKIIVDYFRYNTTMGKAPDEVIAAGIPVWIDHPKGVAHNKVIIIDDTRVIGGSFNYTKQAEDLNAENILFMNSPELAAFFSANWESRQALSQLAQ